MQTFADLRDENYNRNTTKRKTITFVKRESNLLKEKKYNFAPKLDAAALAGARVNEKITPGFRTNVVTVKTYIAPFLVRFGGISGSFGLAMGILARLRLAKIRTMARPSSPDMLPKRTKKVRSIRYENHDSKRGF